MSKNNVTMLNKKQYLSIPFELKQVENNDPDFFVFEGYASTFGNVDSYDDVIVQGAFNQSLKERTPVILWQHDFSTPLGMPEVVREDNKGLFVRVKLRKDDDLVKGRVIPQMKSGSINSMSIGFVTIESEYNSESDIRTIKEVKLMEISLVTFPANEMALVSGFKSDTQAYTIEQVKELTTRQLEDVLRDSGLFSNKSAVYLASKLAGQRETGSDEGEKEEALKSLSDVVARIDGLHSKGQQNALDSIHKSLERFKK